MEFTKTEKAQPQVINKLRDIILQLIVNLCQLYDSLLLFLISVAVPAFLRFKIYF
jgi:hypothetical protein